MSAAKHNTMRCANILGLTLFHLRPYQLTFGAIATAMFLIFGLMTNIPFGYALTFNLIFIGSALVEHVAWALHIEIELSKIAAPRANKSAVAQCASLILFWSLISCLPLLSLDPNDAVSFYLTGTAAAVIFFRTSMMRLQEQLTSRVLNIACAITAALIWLLEVNPIWLWAMTGMSLLTMLPIAANSSAGSLPKILSTLAVELCTYFPPVGRLNKLLNIRVIFNVPVLGVAAISMAWLLIQPLWTPYSNSNPGMPIFGILEALILVNGCIGAFKLAGGWIRQSGEQQLLSVFPTIASVEIRTATIWRQMTALYFAIAFAGIAPRICAALLYPSLFLQSNRAPMTLVLVSLAAVELALITLWIHTRTLRTRTANGEEINRISREIALVQGFNVAMLVLATTSSACGPLVPAYVVVPLLPVALFLAWWERQNWLTAPEPIWQNNVGGQTR